MLISIEKLIQKSTLQKKEDEDEEEDDDELMDDIPPPKFKGGPRSSVSAEAYGKWNQKKEFTPPVIPKDDAVNERIRKALERSFIFSAVDKKDKEVIIDAFSEAKFKVSLLFSDIILLTFIKLSESISRSFTSKINLIQNTSIQYNYS